MRWETLGTLARTSIKRVLVLVEIVIPHCGAKSQMSKYVFQISFYVKSVNLEVLIRPRENMSQTLASIAIHWTKAQ